MQTYHKAQFTLYTAKIPSMLCHCWLGARKGTSGLQKLLHRQPQRFLGDLQETWPTMELPPEHRAG